MVCVLRRKQRRIFVFDHFPPQSLSGIKWKCLFFPNFPDAPGHCDRFRKGFLEQNPFCPSEGMNVYNDFSGNLKLSAPTTTHPSLRGSGLLDPPMRHGEQYFRCARRLGCGLGTQLNFVNRLFISTLLMSIKTDGCGPFPHCLSLPFQPMYSQYFQ